MNKPARKIKGEPPTQWHRPLHGAQSQSARQRKWAPTVYRWLWSSPAADHSYPVCTSTALGEKKKVKNKEKEYMKKCFSNCQKFILGKAPAPSELFEHTQKNPTKQSWFNSCSDNWNKKLLDQTTFNKAIVKHKLLSKKDI